MSDEQIRCMVERFLTWRLPEDFNPDCGISFDKVGNLGTEHQYTREPIGTNLFTYTQADAMVRHMIRANVVQPSGVASMNTTNLTTHSH